MNKNLTERLRKLSLELVEAQHEGDEKRIEAIQEEIWDIEDQLDQEAEDEYSDNHNHDWQ